MSTPLVSVCVFTFNYEKYLQQAIDSIVTQRCNFPFEILICDDCSTDTTLAIAYEFQSKYPAFISVHSNPENQGGTKNWIRAIAACKGKYIALMDGDDYFSDPLKLQRQADAMEKDENLVLCFHSVDEMYDDAPELNKKVIFEKERYHLADFIKNGWFVRTSSTFFRNGIINKDIPEWVHDFPYRFDTILHVLLCMHGDALNIKESMSVWRKHKKGMSFWLMANQVANAHKKIALAEKLNEITGYQFQKESSHFIAREHTYLFFYLLRHFLWWKHPFVTLQSMLKMNFSLFFKMLKGKRHGIKNA